MAEPFLGEMRIVGFNFAPKGWAQCDGQILPIDQNQSLYSLLGTIYGGDGRTSFALPDLRGRVPMHFDGTYREGSKGGEEAVSLSTAQIHSHTHTPNGTTAAASEVRPAGEMPPTTEVNTYKASGKLTNMNIDSALTGGGTGHDNIQPTLVVNVIIALTGLFPSRN